MDRPTTHRWLPFYLIIFSLFNVELGSKVITILYPEQFPTGQFLMSEVNRLLLNNPSAVWEVDYGRAWSLGVCFIVNGIVLIGLLVRKRWAFFVHLVTLVLTLFKVFISPVLFGFVALWNVSNGIYLWKRQYLFDDGKGPYKTLFGKRFRVLDPHVVSESPISEEALYEEVSKEIEVKNLVPGLWTKAFAEADGDENRAKAIYIKLRVAQLAGLHPKIQIQGKCTRSDRDNWVLVVVVLVAICGVAYRMVIQSRDGSSRRLSPACSAVEPYQQPRAAIESSHSQSVVSRESMLAGGDANAVSWEKAGDRWVKNTYANGDVTMSDNFTGRMWVYEASAGFNNWSDAVADCGNLTYAGYSDWRLPDKDTLKAQFSQIGCFAGEQDGGYWSSTSDTNFTEHAWYVHMSNGVVGSWPKFYPFYAWPVRGGHW